MIKTFKPSFLISFSAINWIYCLILTTNVSIVLGIKCVCNSQECDVIRPQDCPGKGVLVLDPCK